MEATYTYSTPRKVTPTVETRYTEELRSILKDYAKPDPSIVQQLPKKIGKNHPEQTLGRGEQYDHPILPHEKRDQGQRGC